MVLIYNVGHVGVVSEVKVKGSETGWIPMHGKWGQVWDTSMKLTGQSLSFKGDDWTLMMLLHLIGSLRSNL